MLDVVLISLVILESGYTLTILDGESNTDKAHYYLLSCSTLGERVNKKKVQWSVQYIFLSTNYLGTIEASLSRLFRPPGTCVAVCRVDDDERQIGE